MRSARLEFSRGARAAIALGASSALCGCALGPDFRPPDLLRLAPAPLYTSFTECQRAVDVLEDTLADRAYEHLAGRDEPAT